MTERTDTERLDWLSERMEIDPNVSGYHADGRPFYAVAIPMFDCPDPLDATLRNAIDAAMGVDPATPPGPTEQRSRRAITRNAARCLRCGDTIESRHRHDRQECSCKSLFVDGGRSYLRRGWKPGMTDDDWEDLSEYSDAA